ncbi:hypothetical protein O181_011803 [Austropuccinia psidii MF-1]|uniref:Uncharacterized protein n=1 Tax=Austropuccinia psidii MF-1 TaxID=1389203 RepID=A0A9Q3GLL9_9BASI|nr:hypothetical protein [Austropuccinia psidii MF-1]
MPEPQRTESGGTEGEDSVSSVSFELITRDYGRRKIQSIRLCTSILKKSSRVWGHNSLYGLLKVLNVGPQSTNQDLPFSSGEVTFLDGPGPLSMGPGHIGKNCNMDPLKPHQILGQGIILSLGDSNSPHIT